jgi:hypothetical protein
MQRFKTSKVSLWTLTIFHQNQSNDNPYEQKTPTSEAPHSTHLAESSSKCFLTNHKIFLVFIDDPTPNSLLIFQSSTENRFSEISRSP